MSSKCTQHVITGFQVPLPPVCVHGLELVIAGTIGPAGAPLVDPFDGGLMGNPSLVELANRGCATTKVLIELTSNASHNLFKASQLVLKVLQSIVENVYLGVLLSNHFTKVTTLTES